MHKKRKLTKSGGDIAQAKGLVFAARTLSDRANQLARINNTSANFASRELNEKAHACRTRAMKLLKGTRT